MTSPPIAQQTSKALAAKIVAFRVLNVKKDDAILAMEELHRRKINGDSFDYEAYINEKIEELPKPSIGNDQISNIKNLLKNVKSGTI